MTKIDPLKRAPDINKRFFGEAVMFTDRTILATYNLLRPRLQDIDLGPQLSTDPLGCALSCAFCWVSAQALAGSPSSPFVRKKINEKTGPFKGQAVNDADEIFDAALKRIAKNPVIRTLSLTGAETLQYRGGIRRLAERAQQEGLRVNVDTAGLQIAHCPGYLDPFEGLQDTLSFYVSIKHIDPVQYVRLTGTDVKHMDDSFTAIRGLLQRGFDVMPGGIILDTFATAADLKTRPNYVTKLYDRMAEIHPLLPQLIIYGRMNHGNVHDVQGLKNRMHGRGYTGLQPNAVRQEIESCWAERGTPVLRPKLSVEKPAVTLYRPYWDQIKADLRTQGPKPSCVQHPQPIPA